MQRAKFVFIVKAIRTQKRLFCRTRLRKHNLRLVIDKRVQLGIHSVDAIKM